MEQLKELVMILVDGIVAKTMLWDSNGNVQKDVWIDGKQWSDKSGNYMWKGNTEVWARWIPKLTYGLTLVYNGATTRGGSDGEIATYNNYFILDGGSPGRKLPGVYGKYRVKNRLLLPKAGTVEM